MLTQFKAKAPTTGFTAPCKEGLIFISHQPIPLETTAYFDNMTRQGYDEYMKFIKDGSRFSRMLEQHGPAADAMVPAAFFQMDGTEDTCTLDFTPNRYVAWSRLFYEHEATSCLLIEIIVLKT